MLLAVLVFVSFVSLVLILLLGLSCLLPRLCILLLLLVVVVLLILRRGNGKLVVVRAVYVAIRRQGATVAFSSCVVIMLVVGYLVRGEMQVVILVEGAEGRRRGTALTTLPGCRAQLSGKVGHLALHSPGSFSLLWGCCATCYGGRGVY